MISEGSCDTEDIQIHFKKYILTHITIENSYKIIIFFLFVKKYDYFSSILDLINAVRGG